MDFVDYKCLESLLIEGEEMIATEGFFSSISKIVKGILKGFLGIIDRFINFIRNLYQKIRNKKPTSNPAPKKESGNTTDFGIKVTLKDPHLEKLEKVESDLKAYNEEGEKLKRKSQKEADIYEKYNYGTAKDTFGIIMSFINHTDAFLRRIGKMSSSITGLIDSVIRGDTGKDSMNALNEHFEILNTRVEEIDHYNGKIENLPKPICLTKEDQIRLLGILESTARSVRLVKQDYENLIKKLNDPKYDEIADKSSTLVLGDAVSSHLAIDMDRQSGGKYDKNKNTESGKPQAAMVQKACTTIVSSTSKVLNLFASMSQRVSTCIIIAQR